MVCGQITVYILKGRLKWRVMEVKKKQKKQWKYQINLTYRLDGNSKFEQVWELEISGNGKV